MDFLGAWWNCPQCGWADKDELKERLRQMNPRKPRKG